MGMGGCQHPGPVSCTVTIVARRSFSQPDSHLTTVIGLIEYYERRRRSLDRRISRHRRATDSRGLPMPDRRPTVKVSVSKWRLSNVRLVFLINTSHNT